MSTSSGAEMRHIVGITPEAMTLEQATNNQTVKKPIVIARDDLKYTKKKLSDNGKDKLEYISLGCPHYSISQIQQAAALLRGRHIHAGTTLQIWTALPIKTIADRSGYTQIIETAGAKVLANSCPLVLDIWPTVKCMAFDSSKQAQYVKSVTDQKVYYGSMKQCIQSAISGYWKRHEDAAPRIGK